MGGGKLASGMASVDLAGVESQLGSSLSCNSLP